MDYRFVIDKDGDVYESIINPPFYEHGYYCQKITFLTKDRMTVGGQGRDFKKSEENKSHIVLDAFLYGKSLTLNKIENKLRFHVEKIRNSL